jgi:hypothetical protein
VVWAISPFPKKPSPKTASIAQSGLVESQFRFRLPARSVQSQQAPNKGFQFFIIGPAILIGSDD